MQVLSQLSYSPTSAAKNKSGTIGAKAANQPSTILWSASAQQSVPRAFDAGKCSQVQKTSADVEIDGLEAPDLTMGKRKGLC